MSSQPHAQASTDVKVLNTRTSGAAIYEGVQDMGDLLDLVSAEFGPGVVKRPAAAPGAGATVARRAQLVPGQVLEWHPAAAADHGWTGPKPLWYSEYLSKHWGVHLPYEQYGLYGSTAAGIGYGAQQVWRSRLLMRAAHEPNATQARELMLEANAKEVDVERAVYLAKKFRARGLLAVVGAPMVWLGLMTLSAAYKRKPKP